VWLEAGALASGSAWIAIAGGVLVAGVIAAPATVLWASRFLHDWRYSDLQIVNNLGESLQISGFDLGHPRLRPGGGHADSWQLEVEHRAPLRDTLRRSQSPAQRMQDRWDAAHMETAAQSAAARYPPPCTALLTGAPAVQAMSVLLSRINDHGARPSRVRAAVAEIEHVGDPDEGSPGEASR
jgi:hypothetical protein